MQQKFISFLLFVWDVFIESFFFSYNLNCFFISNQEVVHTVGKVIQDDSFAKSESLLDRSIDECVQIDRYVLYNLAFVCVYMCFFKKENTDQAPCTRTSNAFCILRTMRVFFQVRNQFFEKEGFGWIRSIFRYRA